jgi:hypothetical protein
LSKVSALNHTANSGAWRIRQDLFGEVWATILEPMLEQATALQAIKLLEHLQSLFPDQYDDKLLCSLQRRVKTLKAIKGPEKEVMFRQEQPPCHQGLSDFTTLKRISLTIQGQPFKHLIYHFRLPYSKWSHLKVIEGGESDTALATGLQEALQRLGGGPAEHRTDSLSAAHKPG